MAVAERSITGKAPYLRHFGLVENPFRITPSPRYTWTTASMAEALAYSKHVIDDVLGVGCVSGEVGTGKTTLAGVINDAAVADGHSVAMLYRVPGDTRQTESKIYTAIADELNLGAQSGRSAEKALRAIQNHAIEAYKNGKTVVVIIDDAHRLRSPGMAALKSLLNLQAENAHLVQVLLFGQLPEMVDVIRHDKAIHSRLATHTRLNPLIPGDVGHMLDHRIRQAGGRDTFFTSDAVDAIFRHSKGVPRVICTIADRSCVRAFEQSPRASVIERRHVDAAAESIFHIETGP